MRGISVKVNDDIKKLDFIKDINRVNDSLDKLELSKKEARKSIVDILEENFYSKSSSLVS